MIYFQRTRSLAVVYALRTDHLDLQVVVARAERPELIHAASPSSRAHVRRIRAVETASPLAAVEILRPAEPLGHAPAGPVHHHAIELVIGQMHKSLRAHARGH